MKSLQGRFAVRTLVVAVHGALAALALMPAMAADDSEVAALTKPTSSVEVGALYVDKDSAKFGEYNGLNEKGTYGIGNFRLFGGDGDASPFRWSLFGNDLGLDTRNLQGEVGVQGRWRVNAGYDEIVRNFSDNYRTIYQGTGTTTLTLPPGWPAAATRLGVTNSVGGVLANWNNIQAPNATATSTGGGPGYLIPANMHDFNLGTQRKIGNVAVSTFFAPGWEFTAGVRREDKDGTKLTGVNIGRFTGVSSLVPEPISSTTDQFNVGVAYADKKANFSLGYNGSLYRNDISLWTVENPGVNNASLGNMARMSSYPDNDMHQVNVGGGYRFTEATKLQVTGSWSRMTQNSAFIPNPTGSTWVVPDTSPHAKVVNSFVFARLTTQATKELQVNASYRYDDRDNKTPVMSFLTTGGDTAGASTLYENEPIKRRNQTFNLEGDYRLSRGQAVKAEYIREDIERSSTADESPFRREKTYEDTVRVEYRRTMSDSLTGRISYAYSDRRGSEYEDNVPNPTSPPAPLPAADPLLPGFEQFFLADRKRDKVRSQLTFQASDAVTLQGTLDYNHDRYAPQYGLKEAKSWVFGLDSSMVASDTLSFNLYYTYEDMRRQLDSLAIARGLSTTNLVAHDSSTCAPYTSVANTLPNDYWFDPCRRWTESQGDRVHTVGLGGLYRGLMAGRLDLSGELMYQQARTPISVSGGTYYSNGVPNSPTANVYITAESFPDIKTELTQLKLQGVYALDKSSAVRVMYIYGKLKSNDWAYDAYANSLLGAIAVQNYIGPNMTSPNYDVNVIGVSYIYRFR